MGRLVEQGEVDRRESLLDPAQLSLHVSGVARLEDKVELGKLSLPGFRIILNDLAADAKWFSKIGLRPVGRVSIKEIEHKGNPGSEPIISYPLALGLCTKIANDLWTLEWSRRQEIGDHGIEWIIRRQASA